MTLSATYLVLLACLGASIIIKYTENLLGLIQEVKAIKAKGETPLTFQTASCIALGFAVELGTSTLLVMLLNDRWKLPANLWAVGLFIGIYAIRNLAAYLVVWGYWAVIVKMGTKKVKQELLEEIGEEEE
uniref:Holin n=1 Tax=Bacillus phage Jabberwock TaxID=3163548 RepID=A0AAU8EGH5_9CAUD